MKTPIDFSDYHHMQTNLTGKLKRPHAITSNNTAINIEVGMKKRGFPL